MVNVSKRKIPQKEFLKLYKQFQKTIANLNKPQSSLFLDDFLTTTEKVMLVKRFAAILMLIEGQSLYRVADTLNLSTSTAKNYWRQYCDGHYRHIETLISKKKKQKEDFWKLLELISRGGLPSMGKDRWTSLRDK